MKFIVIFSFALMVGFMFKDKFNEKNVIDGCMKVCEAKGYLLNYPEKRGFFTYTCVCKHKPAPKRRPNLRRS